MNNITIILNTEEDVVTFMQSSKNEDEWNNNCEIVQLLFHGYPSFWYKAIVASQLANQVASKWGGDGELHISKM